MTPKHAYDIVGHLARGLDAIESESTSSGTRFHQPSIIKFFTGNPISREDAASLGVKRFFTGKPCPQGHIAERKVIGGHCVECHRLNAKRYNAGLSFRREQTVAGLTSELQIAPEQLIDWPTKEELTSVFAISTHKIAIALNLKRFFTGEPCRHGHVDERTVASGNCVACAWRQKNGSDVRRKRYLQEQIRVANMIEPALPEWPRMTHEAATRQGKKRYFVGRMCKAGHIAEQYVGNHECVVCSGKNKKHRYATDPVFRQQYIRTEVERNRLPENSEKRRLMMMEYNKRPERRKKLLHSIKYVPSVRLVWNIKTLLRNSLKRKGGRKQRKLESILGCTKKFFISHIERQFMPGMNWDNRGDWEIDHIVPLSTATSLEDIVALFHHTNLRPLWRAQNRSKGAKVQFLI